MLHKARLPTVTPCHPLLRCDEETKEVPSMYAYYRINEVYYLRWTRQTPS
jgi:hypothetical protein